MNSLQDEVKVYLSTAARARAIGPRRAEPRQCRA